MSVAARRLAPSEPIYYGSHKLAGSVAMLSGGDAVLERAVAVLFAREGADVVLLSRRETGDADLITAAVKKEGRRALVLCGDVHDRDFCQRAVANTLTAFGHLDVLVADADPGCMIDAAEPHLRPGAALIISGAAPESIRVLAAARQNRGIRVNGIAPAHDADSIAPAYVFFASPLLSGPLSGQMLG